MILLDPEEKKFWDKSDETNVLPLKTSVTKIKFEPDKILKILKTLYRSLWCEFQKWKPYIFTVSSAQVKFYAKFVVINCQRMINHLRELSCRRWRKRWSRSCSKCPGSVWRGTGRRSHRGQRGWCRGPTRTTECRRPPTDCGCAACVWERFFENQNHLHIQNTC